MDWIPCKISKTLSQKTTYLPTEDGEITVKTEGCESYIVLKVFGPSKKAPEEISTKKCKAVTRPKNATAKRFAIDLVDSIYTEIALTFNKCEDLKKALDALAREVGEAAVKKVASKSLTTRFSPSSYSKPSQKPSNVLRNEKQKYEPVLTTTPNRTNVLPLSTPISQVRTNSRQAASLHITQQESSSEASKNTRNVPSSKILDSPKSRKRNHKNEEEDNPFGYPSGVDENAGITKDSKKAKNEEEFNKYPPYKETSPEKALPYWKGPDPPSSPHSISSIASIEDLELNAPDNPVFKSSPLKYTYTKPSSYDVYEHRSMVNLGNSCYMNASLQALASLPQFVTELCKAVPEEKYRVDQQPRRSDILQAIVNVFNHIFSAPQKIPKDAISQEMEGSVPRELLKAVREAAGQQIDRSMGLSTQHDAQEFLSRLLEIIEEEIDGKQTNEDERPTSDKENYSAEDLGRSASDQREKQKMEETSAFLPSFTGIVSKPKTFINPGSLFKITCYNRLICNDCGYIVKKEETDRDVQLGMGINEPSITDLLRMQFERHDIAWKCTKCNSTRASMSTSFKELPEYLIIVLKRYGYEELTGGNKSSDTVKVDRELHVQMFCEGSELKENELKKIPLPVPSQNENGEDMCEEAEVVPESPEATTSRQYPKGFNSPKKSVVRELFPKSSLDEMDHQGSQNPLFNTYDEIEKDSSINVEYGCKDDHTPEPTKESVPSTPDAIADKLADSNVFSKSSEEDPYDQLLNLKQTGGAVLTVENKPRKSQAHLENCDSEDSAVIVENVKKAASIQWKPLTPGKIFDGQQIIESAVATSVKDIRKWAESSLDNHVRDIPIRLSRRNFKKSSVDGDGACLFRCFSWWLFQGSEEHHDIIRGKICDFIERFSNEFSPLAGKEWNGFGGVKDYIGFMRRCDEWGTHLEISAMATLLRCTIYSYHNNSWTRFPPRFKYKEMGADRIEDFVKDDGEVANTSASGAIYIYNSNNRHFEPVWGIINEEDILGKESEEDITETPMDLDLDLNSRETPPPQVSDNEDEKNNQFNDISLGPYVYKESDGPVYTLSAVVNHKGMHLNHGHYTAYSFDADRNTWLNCDDSSINPTTEKVVLTQSRSSGYLFIYRRRHPNDEGQFKID